MLLRRWAFEPNRIFWQCSGGAICLSLLQTGQSVRWSRRLDLSWTRCCLLWSDKKGRKQLPPLMISWAVGAFCCPKIECPVLHFIKSNDHRTEYLGRFKYLFWTIKNGTDRALTDTSVSLLFQYRCGGSWRCSPYRPDHYLRQQQHRRSSLYQWGSTKYILSQKQASL